MSTSPIERLCEDVLTAIGTQGVTALSSDGACVIIGSLHSLPLAEFVALIRASGEVNGVAGKPDALEQWVQSMIWMYFKGQEAGLAQHERNDSLYASNSW